MEKLYRVLNEPIMGYMEHYKYSTTGLKKSFFKPQCPHKEIKFRAVYAQREDFMVGSIKTVCCGHGSARLCFLLLFSSRSSFFVAGSWIICAYALLLDDSCAVGLRAVFQNRWIMNKPPQQKIVLHKPGLPASVPARASVSPTGEGTGDQVHFSRDGGVMKCFYREIFIPIICSH